MRWEIVEFQWQPLQLGLSLVPIPIPRYCLYLADGSSLSNPLYAPYLGTWQAHQSRQTPSFLSRRPFSIQFNNRVSLLTSLQLTNFQLMTGRLLTLSPAWRLLSLSKERLDDTARPGILRYLLLPTTLQLHTYLSQLNISSAALDYYNVTASIPPTRVDICAPHSPNSRRAIIPHLT